MKRTFLSSLLLCGLFLAIGTTIAGAKEGTITLPKFVQQRESVEKNQRLPLTTPIPASSSPVLSVDNLQEFIQQQEAELKAFRSRQQEELKQKKAAVTEGKRSCAEKIKAVLQDLKTKRTEVLKSCKPTFTGEPTNAEERTQRRTMIKEAQTACRTKLSELETQTKNDRNSILVSCFNTERKVLGLSTVVPYSQE